MAGTLCFHRVSVVVMLMFSFSNLLPKRVSASGLVSKRFTGQRSLPHSVHEYERTIPIEKTGTRSKQEVFPRKQIMMRSLQETEDEMVNMGDSFHPVRDVRSIFASATLDKHRIKRFGIMEQFCVSKRVSDPTYLQENKTSVCDHQYQLRTNLSYATEYDYPADYAVPMKLFSDLGNMEMNDPCRMCIEDSFRQTIIMTVKVVPTISSVMLAELQRLANADHPNSGKANAELVTNGPWMQELANGVDEEKVEEMYFYLTVRKLYADFGAPTYKKNYEAFQASDLGNLCSWALGEFNPDSCKPQITLLEASGALLNHADHAFSSVSTAGNPFPFWGADGDGYLFDGTSPVSGSGLNLTGLAFSSLDYFDISHYNTEGWNPLYAESGYIDIWSYEGLVDPVFEWFKAGETIMESKCNNGYLKGTSPSTPFTSYYNSTTAQMANITEKWCTDDSVPHTNPENRTVQHFAKMWYDLLINLDDPDKPDSDSILNVTFRYSVEVNVTAGGRSLEDVISDFRDNSIEQLNETISASDAKNQYVKFRRMESNVLEPCPPSDGMEGCALMESSVFLSITDEIDARKFDLAILDEVKKHVEGYEQDDTVRIKFIGPIHLRGRLIIELVGVPPTKMENKTVDVFEDILLQILSEYMSENVPQLSIEAVTVFLQELYLSSQRHRLGETEAWHRSLGSTAKNRVHVYVDGKCDCDNLETDELFEDAVNAEGERVKKKLKESDEEYFDDLEKIEVIPIEETRDIPDTAKTVAEDLPEKISKERVPAWIYITFGVSSFVLLVSVIYILRKRFVQMGKTLDEDETETDVQIMPAVSV